MREISVDLDVYSAIWAARLPPEANENDMLRRILLRFLEVKTSKGITPRQDGRPMQDIKMNSTYRIRWIDDVLDAFRRLGGEADLASVYSAVSDIRHMRGEKQIETLEATVRRAIEEHSSDSANLGRNASAPDYFTKVERGRWRLRS